MKNLAVFILAFMAFQAHSQYYLTWADEFNDVDGAGLNPTYWNYETGCICFNGETVCYTNSNTNVRHNGAGDLLIIAKAETGSCGQPFTSGRINTQGKLSQLNGRWEARIKVPDAQGTWPAFWLLGEDINTVDWPACGEIDIMEAVWGDISKNHGSAHGPGYNGGNAITNSIDVSPATLKDDYHIYAIEWTTDSIRYFFDGIKFHEFSRADADNIGTWAFDTEMFIILNVAVGGSWPDTYGQPAAVEFPDTMYVDYVRVYSTSPRITGPVNLKPFDTGTKYTTTDDPGFSYNWSVPAGASIVSGAGTHEITVDWGSTGGTVSVNITDGGSVNFSPTLDVNVSSNQFLNPGFEDDFAFWGTVLASGAATFNINNSDTQDGAKAAEVNVNVLGTNVYDIQLTHANKELQSGTQYELQFWAKADANGKNIQANFIENGGSYTNYHNKSFVLTNAWQLYTFTFVSSVTDLNALFTLDLGFDRGLYLFDNFSFESTTCQAASVNFANNPLTHSGQGSNSETLNLPANSSDISFDITGIDQRTSGRPSNQYIESVTVTYVDGQGSSQTYGTFSGSNVSSASILISGEVQSITIFLTDGQDGNSGSGNMSIDFSPVNYCEAGGPCVSPDADGDGICDAQDVCPGFDDNLDADGDGVPDGCDICVGGDDNLDTDNDGTPDFCDACPLSATGDSDGDGVCDDADVCPGSNDNLDADGDGVPDGCDICAGGDDNVDTDNDGTPDFCDICPLSATGDSDGDGVCDDADICPGFDDNIDTDGDGIPDGCDSNCSPITNQFPVNPLSHSGGGSSSTTLNFSTNRTDVDFSISNINQKINGNPSTRYIDVVTVTYVDALGSTQTYGTFSGASVSSAQVTIAQEVQSVTVSLENGYGGNASVQVDFSSVSSCEAGGARWGNSSQIGKLIQLYPNPTNDRVTIDFGETLEQGKIRVMDVVGKVYLESTFNTKSSLSIDLRNIEKTGVLLIEVEIPGRENQYLKLIKYSSK